MEKINTVIAVLPDHQAPKRDQEARSVGIRSQVTQRHSSSYQTEEHVIGFYNVADRITSGPSWRVLGGLWGLFFSGVLSRAVTGRRCLGVSRASRSRHWKAQ